MTLLKEELQKRIDFSGGSETLRIILHETRFRWKKTQTNRSLLMERTNIVAARVQFIRKMRKMRADGRTIVYTDETFVHTSHCVHRSWHSESVALKVPFGKGERFIGVHAGTDKGFIQGVSLVFKAKTSQRDYHNEMNGENFMRWLNERLLPNLPPNSVLVVDNAPYHNRQEDKCPTTATRKAEIQAWMDRNRIPYNTRMLKAELLQICKTQRPQPEYVLGNILRQHGHDCLRLPAYNADLNAIELVWAQVKGYVARQNSSFKSAGMMQLIENGLQSVTSEQWKSCCEHVCSVEEKYWANDVAIEEEMERLIITVTSSDEDTDTASETDDYSDTDSDFGH